jgi:hypothetical protein
MHNLFVLKRVRKTVFFNFHRLSQVHRYNFSGRQVIKKLLFTRIFVFRAYFTEFKNFVNDVGPNIQRI